MTGGAPIRILTVDDHGLLREGVAALLASEPDMAVVGGAGTGREAIQQQFRAVRPDITLMDLRMPDMSGVEAIIAIRVEFPDAQFIVLATYSGDVQVVRAPKVGASGYLLKTLVHKELADTIRTVHAGRKTLSPEVSFELAEHVTDDAVTPAEIEVWRLIAAGNANKQIADRLGIAEDTVKGRSAGTAQRPKGRTHPRTACALAAAAP